MAQYTVYFDVDGTLGKWYADARGYECLEQIIDPANHYFRDIDPHPFMIDLAKQLQEDGVDVCVLTATDERCQEDRLAWLADNMPFIDQSHIIMCPVGADKAEYVENSRTSILIDDYNKNLDEWSKGGGVAIKARNTVNSPSQKYAEINMVTPEEEFLTSYPKFYNIEINSASRLIKSELSHLAERETDKDYQMQVLGKIIESTKAFLEKDPDNENLLWAKTIEMQINEMHRLYDSLSADPQYKEVLDTTEGFGKADIDELERDMLEIRLEQYQTEVKWLKDYVDNADVISGNDAAEMSEKESDLEYYTEEIDNITDRIDELNNVFFKAEFTYETTLSEDVITVRLSDKADGIHLEMDTPDDASITEMNTVKSWLPELSEMWNYFQNNDDKVIHEITHDSEGHGVHSRMTGYADITSSTAEKLIQEARGNKENYAYAGKYAHTYIARDVSDEKMSEISKESKKEAAKKNIKEMTDD